MTSDDATATMGADTTMGVATTDPTGPDTSGSTTEDPTEGMTTGDPVDCHPILAEVLYDPMGMENERQWIKLYNRCAQEIDLTSYSLGWGGEDYTIDGLDLQGTIEAGNCFLVGGPDEVPQNADPMLDFPVDFDGNLERSGGMDSGGLADGVALFDRPHGMVADDTVPVDAVIYGTENGSGLLDSTGATPPPHVADAGSSDSIQRTALDTWQVQSDPMPNSCPDF